MTKCTVRKWLTNPQETTRIQKSGCLAQGEAAIDASKPACLLHLLWEKQWMLAETMLSSQVIILWHPREKKKKTKQLLLPFPFKTIPGNERILWYFVKRSCVIYGPKVETAACHLSSENIPATQGWELLPNTILNSTINLQWRKSPLEQRDPLRSNKTAKHVSEENVCAGLSLTVQSPDSRS